MRQLPFTTILLLLTGSTLLCSLIPTVAAHQPIITATLPPNDDNLFNEYEGNGASSSTPTAAPSRKKQTISGSTQCRTYRKSKTSCCLHTPDCSNTNVPSGCVWQKKKCITKTPNLPASCTSRTGGAIITFSVMDEDFSMWSTDNTFIDMAINLRRLKSTSTPVFTLLPGQDSCGVWGFYPDPNNMKFTDYPNNCMSDSPGVIASLTTDITGIKWCPWGAYGWTIYDMRIAA